MAQGGGSGLNEAEARAFHGVFIASFIGFTLIAAVAHFAAWQWRPWLPGVAGYSTASNTSAPALNPTATVAASPTR